MIYVYLLSCRVETYDSEREQALGILHKQLRSKGKETFYKQPKTDLSHAQASEWYGHHFRASKRLFIYVNVKFRVVYLPVLEMQAYCYVVYLFLYII